MCFFHLKPNIKNQKTKERILMDEHLNIMTEISNTH